MTDDTPTSDRILLGLAVGAAVGGVAFPATWAIQDGELPHLGSWLGLWLSTAFILLLLLPLLFTPVWWVVHLIGLRGALGGALAGVLSLTFPFMIAAMFAHHGSDEPASSRTLALYFAAPAALIGLVIWRVSHWRIEA